MGCFSKIKILSIYFMSSYWERRFKNSYSKEQERLLEISCGEATDSDKTEIYRFDKLVFELTQPSFILQGTWNAHFNNCGQDFRDVVEKVSEVIYVTDSVTWGEFITKVNKLKSESISFLRQVHK